LTFLVFLLMEMTPGDAALTRLASQGSVTEEALQLERERLGLDRPFLVRYADWIFGVVRGDFGNSYIDDRPILPKLMDALGHTLILAAASTVIALPLGVFTAIKKDSIPDNIIRILTFTGNAMPNFLIALLLMYIFCVKMNLFPVIAKESVQGLFLPVMALVVPMASKFARQTRADVLAQLGEEYVIGMHARGVRERVILYRNVLHNAMGSIFTIISLQIRTLLGGSIVTETIFRWPGVGMLIMDSINGHDYPTIQGAVLIMATLQVLINLLTDISYCVIDRRIELE